MKKRVNYRLSDKCIQSISFLLEKKWGKDATHVIECAVASAEAMWHMRDRLNEDTNAITLVEQKVHEHRVTSTRDYSKNFLKTK